MKLSQRISALTLPVSENQTSSYSANSASSIEQIAARFRVVLPDLTRVPDEQKTEFRRAFLRDWEAAALEVVGSLFPAGTVVSTSAIRSGTAVLVDDLEKIAPRLLSQLAGSWWDSVRLLTTVMLPNPVQLSAESLRQLLYYVFVATRAGSDIHASELALEALESGALSEGFLNRDYELRVGAYQAIVAIAKLGLLDELEVKRSGQQGLGVIQWGAIVGLAIVVGVAVGIAALAWTLISLYQITAHNAQLRALVESVCGKPDPKTGLVKISPACIALTTSLGTELAKNPPPRSSSSDSLYGKILLGLGVVAGIMILPDIISGLRRSRERR